MDKEFDIEKIREEFARLLHNLNWYERRGGLLPYDWHSYGHPHICNLKELLRLDFEGNKKYKDKKGSWRVIKDKSKINSQ